ncbi:hypothetical protein L6452_13746 [Arctium lappa]|uniref:Uncharacterized protein n=1 Tax=Arctium lappa TaxID=4217 RepID=A0ACB9CJ21_ARCLA|nr:hypothetical protein L6452_13746 [Arctium lappa]
MLCERKSIDRSQPEESRHLIEVFEKCWEEEKLLDMIDRSCGDMLDNDTTVQSTVLEMMKLALWCLHWDLTKRPSIHDRDMLNFSYIKNNLSSSFPIEYVLSIPMVDPLI